MKGILEGMTEMSDIIKSLGSLGLDISDITEKLNKAFAKLSDKTVSIVLLGSFSDGKTTVISGLLGKLLENMKIDSEESSDEIIEYRADFLGKDFRIIDTPGLFGNKEIKSEKQTKKLSDITQNYLSAANIVIYVCEAVNPLPESHRPLMHTIMRDLRKLPDTIFVINKMDEADYSLIDEIDYQRGQQIKKENLKNKLRDTLNLTSQEVENLNIVCISANPASKDLEDFWFKQPILYNKWSKIENLRELVKKFCTATDKKTSSVKSAVDMSLDIAKNLDYSIEVVKQPLQKNLLKIENLQNDLQTDLEITKENLNTARTSLRHNLDTIESDYKMRINSASLDTIGDILDYIGKDEDGNINFSILLRKIENAQSDCFEAVNAEIEKRIVEFENKSTLQGELLNDALKKSAGFLKNAKISPEMVNKVRDMFFKNFKFKPWGKIKLAAKLTKSLAYLGAALAIGMEIYEYIKIKKANKKLAELKEQLKTTIIDIFNELHKSYNDQENFYHNYAPSFLEMQKGFDIRAKEINAIRERIDLMGNYQRRLSQWGEEMIDTAEFEEIK